MWGPVVRWSRMAPVYRFPTAERFSCESCTKCCRTLAVRVTADEAARIPSVRNRHGLADPFERDSQGEVTLRHVDGACVFLETDGRCAIHAQIGFDAKPAPCRKFPFNTVVDPDGTRFVRASFSCPTVVANRGDGPEELAASIERDARPARLPATYRLGGTELAPVLYERIEETVGGLIADAPDLPRAIAATGMLMAELDNTDLEATLAERTAPEALARLMADARPFRRRDARLLLAPFLLLAAPSEQSRPSRAVHAVRLLLGRGHFRTWAAPADVPLSALDAVRFAPEREPRGGLVRRYLVHLLRSRVFLTGLPVEMQINLVGVAYALVRWNARARAAIAGRSEVSDADVTTAVQDTEREHFGHNATEARLLCNSWIGIWLDLMFRGPRRLAGLVMEPSS